MKKKISIFILILICIIIAGGCRNIDMGNDSNGKQDTMPIVLTMYSEDRNLYDNNFQNPVARKITEKTGVILKFDYPVGNVNEKVALMIAAKDYPDLMFTKGTSFNQLVEAGALRNLTPMIDKLGTNIKKLYGSHLKALKYKKDDESIYSLSAFMVDSEKLEPAMGFEIQHAVVKELGFPKIETVQDFENAIKEYKEKHPDIDGEPAIGLSLLSDDWRWTISLGNGAGFATGAPDDGNWYIDPETYKTVYRFTRPEEKEYYRWLNHMNNIGLLDPDSFVQKYDQYLAKIASGRVLSLIDAKWEYNPGEERLKSDGKFERTYGMYPVQLNKSFKSQEFRDVAYAGNWGVSISIGCKDPERAMEFLDWMASDEAHILRYWGIEGVNYRVENGRRIIIDEQSRNYDKYYKRNTGVLVYSYPFPSWGIGQRDSTGQLYIPASKDDIIKSYSPIEKEVLNAYGKETWAGLYPSKDEIPYSPWGLGYLINIPSNSELALILKKCDGTMKSMLPRAVLSKPEEFDRVWDAIMNELKKHGVEKANEDFTMLVKEQVDRLK